MRKIIFLMHMSLDGFVAGPNGEMDWIIHEDDVAERSYSLHSTTDAAIYGRVTYDMMANYWPQVLTNPDMPDVGAGEMAHAKWADTATKYVVSNSLEETTWRNSVILRGDIPAEIRKIKAQAGKHIWLLGSPSVAQLLMEHDLIDEYRLNINPIILGQGLPLFSSNLQQSLQLKLIETRTLTGGVVSLCYAPARAD